MSPFVDDLKLYSSGRDLLGKAFLCFSIGARMLFPCGRCAT